MSSVAVYSYTDEDLHKYANQVKEVLFASLANDGELEFETHEDFERFCASYVVVMSRPGVFGRLWDKVFGSEGGSIITVLKSALPSPGSKAPVLKLVKKEKQ